MTFNKFRLYNTLMEKSLDHSRQIGELVGLIKDSFKMIKGLTMGLNSLKDRLDGFETITRENGWEGRKAGNGSEEKE